MAKIDDPVLPTDFAITLCEEYLIIPQKMAGGKNAIVIQKVKKQIADFQRLAINSSFEQALIAFYGTDFNEKQEEVLKIIHTSTRPFILGLTADACLQAVTHRTLTKSEFAEAIKTITELVKAPEDKAGETGRPKGILVKVTQKEKV
jgi:hypothetical protein